MGGGIPRCPRVRHGMPIRVCWWMFLRAVWKHRIYLRTDTNGIDLRATGTDNVPESRRRYLWSLMSLRTDEGTEAYSVLIALAGAPEWTIPWLSLEEAVSRHNFGFVRFFLQSGHRPMDNNSTSAQRCMLAAVSSHHSTKKTLNVLVELFQSGVGWHPDTMYFAAQYNVGSKSFLCLPPMTTQGC